MEFFFFFHFLFFFLSLFFYLSFSLFYTNTQTGLRGYLLDGARLDIGTLPHVLDATLGGMRSPQTAAEEVEEEEKEEKHLNAERGGSTTMKKKKKKGLLLQTSTPHSTGVSVLTVQRSLSGSRC